jgi:hypothetical protein
LSLPNPSFRWRFPWPGLYPGLLALLLAACVGTATPVVPTAPAVQTVDAPAPTQTVLLPAVLQPSPEPTASLPAVLSSPTPPPLASPLPSATRPVTTTVAPPTPEATPAPVSGPSPLGRAENVSLVGQADLGRRGWNAGLALVYPCAYVGNRRLPQIAIVDVSDPATPVLAGALPLAPGSQSIELRAVPDLGLLVVLNASPALSVLTFDVSDCARPRPLGTFSLGATPHEFYLWRDPANPGRLLLYAAMWSHQQPDLHVLDLTDPAAPRRVGAWTASAAGAPGTLHSLSLSLDGRRTYLALWEGGFLLADSSDFALGLPQPQLRLLPADGQPAPLPGLNVHSAVPLADPRYVLLTREIYGCPFGDLLVADVLDPARPRLASRFGLPENEPACAALPQPDAVFTAHNPLVVGDLAFVTWYGGGLQVLDVRDPASPRRVGVYVPSGAGAARGSYVGTYPAQLWSYPVLRQGLLYVADIQSGLHILRYTGPGAEAVNTVAHAEGNLSILP